VGKRSGKCTTSSNVPSIAWPNNLSLAELEELESVDAAKKKALDLGLVECLVEKPKILEECPLCCEDIPNVHPADFGTWQQTRLFHRLYCCGAICCMRCITRRNNNILREFQKFETLDRVPNDDELHYMVELKHRMEAAGTCPFCRSKNFGVEHMISLLRGHVEKNKSWAY
jgi:hypothetical protein